MTDIKDSLNSSTNMARSMLLLNTAKLASNIGTTAHRETLSNNALEKDLYENSQAKEADLKTRAYIYIKQHGRKPIRNRPYNSPIIPQSGRNSQQSYMMNIKLFEELPRQFSIGYLSQNANSETPKPDHKCYAMRAKQNSNEAKSKINSKPHNYKALSKEQRQFLDLLKTPSCRPEAKNDKGVNNVKDLSKNRQKVKPYHTNNLPEPIKKQDLKRKIRDEVTPTNGNGQVNYQKGLQDNGFLLNELIKQKLGEDGSLFVCDDCLNKARRNKLRSGLHLQAMCKCGTSSNRSPLGGDAIL